jgi:hypothetical protein
MRHDFLPSWLAGAPFANDSRRAKIESRIDFGRLCRAAPNDAGMSAKNDVATAAYFLNGAVKNDRAIQKISWAESR